MKWFIHIHIYARHDSFMRTHTTKRSPHLTGYRVAKWHRMPYLHRSLSAKEPYNYCSFAERDLQLKASCASSPPCTPSNIHIYIYTWCDANLMHIHSDIMTSAAVCVHLDDWHGWVKVNIHMNGSCRVYMYIWMFLEEICKGRAVLFTCDVCIHTFPPTHTHTQCARVRCQRSTCPDFAGIFTEESNCTTPA